MNNTLNTLVIPIEIPSRVLSPNCMIGSIGGRYMKAAASKRQLEAVKALVEDEQIEDSPWNAISVEPVFYFETKRKHDDDNAMGSLKSAYDGIVKAGLVIDDDSEHMHKLRPIFYMDRSCPRVELHIRRLA